MINKYQFESSNKGTIFISIDWRYYNDTVDLTVITDDNVQMFYDMDGGSTTEIIEWLLGEGVRFTDCRSMRFVNAYIASVMIDGDATLTSLLDEAAKWTDEECREWVTYQIGDVA